MTALQMDIGTANSGVGVATGADPVNFASSIGSYTATGNIVYGAANTVFTLTQNVNLATGGLSFTVAEGVNVGTSAISSIAIHEFNFSITYANPVATTTTTTITNTLPLQSTYGQGYSISTAATATGSTQPTTGAVTCTLQPQPTGTATTIGPVSINAANGTAQCPVPATQAAGGYSVTATYGGSSDSAFASSTSVAATLTITPAPTTTTVAVTSSSQPANPSLYGQSVTFAATVALPVGNTGTIDGSVVFSDADGPLPGCAAGGTAVVNGVASCQTASLGVGTHAIVATYAPTGMATNTNNTLTSSNTPPFSQIVGKAATTTNVTAPAPIALGGSVSISASLSVTAPGIGAPSGTLTISDGGSAAGDSCTIAVTAAVSSGACSLTPSTAGTKTLSATFTPDNTSSASFNGGTNAAQSPAPTLQVNPSQPGANLASSANPSSYGQTVSLTGTVTPLSGGVTPTGVVHFLFDGNEICPGTQVAAPATPGTSAQPASATCAVPQTVLTVTPSSTPHSVTFKYDGDANNTASSATLQGAQAGQAVNAANTHVSIAQLSAITLGQAISVGVTVSAQAPGAGTPDGTVTIADAGTNCMVTLDANGAGSCSFTPPAPAGNHGINASYVPAIHGATTNFVASSSNTTLTVNSAAAGSVLTSSANPSQFGQNVTFTATLTPASGNPLPTGSVDFVDTTTNTTVCAGVMLVASNGNATAACATAGLSSGVHPLQANYAGDGNTQSSSGSLIQTVNALSTSMTLNVTPNPATAEQKITLIATVAFVAPASATATTSANALAVAPSGAVTFADGVQILGMVNLDPNGVATLSAGPLGVGSHTLTATYSNNGDQATATAILEVRAADPAVPVPALSAWMLGMLGVLLALAGWQARRRVSICE